MIQFQCDYNEGAHPLIIKRLTETNMEQTVGYGEDPHCEKARRLIKQACQSDNADVHFLVGGTQANTTVIAHILRPYQGVLAATSGHINVHETGAIESTGHKVLAIPTKDGKLTAKQIDEAMQAHIHEDGPEHMVQPGMVYLSFPTEIGTIYSHDELKAIRTVCDKYHLPLFVDGARLGYGLCSPECDLTLPQLSHQLSVLLRNGKKQILHHSGMKFTGRGTNGEYLSDIEIDHYTVLHRHNVVQHRSTVRCGIGFAKHFSC